MDSLTVLSTAAPVLPVIIINNEEDALPLANAFMEGGVNVIEITLRTPAAMKAIETIKKALPDVTVGAGTVINTEQFDQVADAGGDFIVSPGVTHDLLTHATHRTIPFIPGVHTATDVMLAVSHGLKYLKFFPAEEAGGIAMLKRLHGPFNEIHFCPTGGINAENVKTYLSLDNVLCVGGSWLAPQQLIQEKNWKAITQLARVCQQSSCINLA